MFPLTVFKYYGLSNVEKNYDFFSFVTFVEIKIICHDTIFRLHCQLILYTHIVIIIIYKVNIQTLHGQCGCVPA